ncbi:dephospho-CoA kinase [Labilibacter sediminis]|nr:dephospho-CoA kinase [Labilibacter sediminis]
MIKVGITGGIGSGKSTICKVFETLGIPVYNSDLESRVLSNIHPVIIKETKKLFGDHIYVNDVLDRKAVGEIVFADKSKLQALNSIIHPVVAGHFNEWLERHSGAPYIIKETAVLFESGADKNVDYIISVIAPLELRVKRVVLRDDITEEEVLSRVNNQIKDEERVRLSNDTVLCDDVELVIPQVLKIHHKLLNLYS